MGILRGWWTVDVPSNWANVANFVLFDVVLVSLAFTLTADVTGRLNDAALRDGTPRTLYLLSPPVVGGGLCGTQCARVRAMAAVRLLVLVLVLLSNVCIRGASVPTRVRARARVLVEGTLRSLDPPSFADALIVRAGCQRSMKNVSFYGDLIVDDDGLTRCITDRDLVENAPTFSRQLEQTRLATGPCGLKLRERWPGAPRIAPINAIAEMHCRSATLSCYVYEGQVLNATCRGFVRSKYSTYLCNDGAVFPERPIMGAMCRLVSNVDWKSTAWMDAAFLAPFPVSMIDAVHAMYAARTEIRDIYVRVDRQFTTVRQLWALVLAILVLLVSSVAFISIVLRLRGLRAVAHDEHGLAEMLRNQIADDSASGPCSASDRSTTSDRSSSDIFLDVVERSDGSKVVCVKAATVKPANEQIHKAEEQFW